MKPFITILSFFFLLIPTLNAQNWLRKAGGVSNDAALGVAKDNTGNLYITGFFSFSSNFEGTNVISSGQSDVFLMKTDPSGQIVWLVKAGGQDQDKAYAVAVDSAGNVYITGFFTGQATFGNQTVNSVAGSQDVFVAKYDITGNFIWVKTFGGIDSDLSNDVAVDGDGNVYITGQFKETINVGGNNYTSTIDPVFGAPSYDIFIASYDANGNLNWFKQGAADYEDRGLALAVDAQNNIYAPGQFSDTLTLGQTTYYNTSYNSSYLIKMDQQGNEQWFKRFTAAFVSINDLEMSGSGLLYVVGDFTGHLVIAGPPYQSFYPDHTRNYFISAITPSGSIQWLQSDGSDNFISASSVSLDDVDNAYVAGEFKCVLTEYQDLTEEGVFNSVGYRDIFMAKFQDNGTRELVRHIGGPNEDQCFGVAATGVNKPILCGSFSRILNIPAGSNFSTTPGMSIDTSSHGPNQSFLTYCSENYYGRFVSSLSYGQSDIFYSHFLDLNRSTYDFYHREPGACHQPVVPAIIDPDMDTIIGCDSVLLSVETFTGENALIGPNWTFLWSTGETEQSIWVSQNGWYHVTAGHIDGCRSFIDSIFVMVNPTPAGPQIQSTYGQVLEAIPISPCRFKLIIPDTVNASLFVSNLPPGNDLIYEWNTPDGVVNDSVVAITSPGLYTFTSYPLSTPMCGTTSCIEVYFFTFGSGSGPGGGGGTPYNPQIFFLDSLQEATDTVKVCEEGTFNVVLEDSLTFMNGDTTLVPFFVSWNISGSGSAFINPNPSFYGIPNTFMYHEQSFEGHSSGNMIITANLFLNQNILFGTVTRNFYLDVVTIPPLNPIISGPAYICPGDTVLLTTSGTGGDITFTGGNIWHSADYDSILVTQDGNYRIRCIVTEPELGCKDTFSYTFNLPEKPDPIILSQPASALICPYDSVLLSTIPASSYIWYGPDGAIVGNSNNIYVYAPGLYHCQLVDLDGCTRVSELFEVYEYTTPYLEADDVGLLCSGADVTITVQTYDESLIVWAPPLTGSGPVVSVSEEGTYSCSVSLCGITTNLSITLELSDLDVSLVLTGNDTICEGESVTITTNPGMSSYQWSNGDDGSNVLQVEEAGSYYVTIGDVYGCEFQSDTIEIFSLPSPAAPVVSDTIICTGADLSFDLNTGFTVVWFEDPYATAVDTGILVLDSVTSDISYFAANWDSTCSSLKVPLNVEINPISYPPVIEGDSTLCPGDTLTLLINDPVQGGAYQWQGPNGFNESGDSITVIIQSTDQLGVYSVSSSDSMCQSLQTDINISVGELPEADIVLQAGNLCLGDSVQLGLSQTFPDVVWLPSNTSGPSIWVSTDTVVYVEVENQSGCRAVADTFAVLFNDPPADPLPIDTVICFGQDISLAFNTSYDVLWYDNASDLTPIDTALLELDSVTADVTVYVTFNDTLCHSAYVPVNIQVNQTSTLPVIEGDTLICPGETLELDIDNPQTGGTYTWQGPNNFSSQGTSVSITPFTAASVGEYSVSVTDGYCGSDTATINIVSGTLPQGHINIVGGDSIGCAGQNMTLNTPSGQGTLTWYPGNQHTTSISVNQPGQYWLEVVNQQGCRAFVDTVTLVFQTPPPSPAAFDTTVCPGTSFDISINSNYDINWYSNNGGLIYFGPTLHIQGLVNPVSYQIANVTPEGCASAKVPVNINLVPLPLNPPLYVDTHVVCEGTAISMSTIHVPGATYEWITPVDTIPGDSSLVIDPAGPEHAGLYWAAIYLQGCKTNSNATQISVKDQPKFQDLAYPDPICENDNILVTATAEGNAIITWHLPNGDEVEAYELELDSLQLSDNGEYTASFVWDGCPSEVIEIPLIIRANPELEVADTSTCIGASVLLSVPDSFAYATWQGSSSQTYEYTATDTGYYIVNVYNGYDCMSFDTIKVDWVDCELNVPNVFTPDGDNYNDVFFLDDTHFLEIHVQIYNRFGRLIYSWDEKGGNWDGTNQNNGKQVAEGVYYYIANGKTADEKIRDYSGFIEVIRGN